MAVNVAKHPYNPSGYLRMPKRKLWLYVGDTLFDSERQNALNVRFKISHEGRRSIGRGQVSVENISNKRAFELQLAVKDTGEMTSKYNIDLFAGYEHGRFAKIMTGTCRRTNQTGTPTGWYDFTCYPNNGAFLAKWRKTYENTVTVREIMKEITDYLQVSLLCDYVLPSDDYKYSFPNFATDGTIRDCIVKIKRAFPELDIFFDLDRYVVTNYEYKKNTWHVNAHEGMIGIPSFLSFKIVKVKVLLNPHIRPLDEMVLESSVVSYANGTYRITHVTHEGELRGQSWYTEVEAFRLTEVNDVYFGR